MIIYNVRARALIDIVNEMKSQRLIVSPYFQRNLVWRLVHKKDFIDTILRGYPFPEIFIARGRIDVQTMTATSCVVDGQQRLTAIREFISDEFEVNDRKFSELDVNAKEDFLKYQVAIIELDMKEDDPTLIEIFKRLNRTFYSLSSIEKYSTEYAASEFMVVAKLLCDELSPDEEAEGGPYAVDPNIPKESLEWAMTKAPKNYRELVLDGKIFSSYETQRMIHLMFTLNAMATSISGFYNRNDGAKKLLDEFSQEFAQKDELVARFNEAAGLFRDIKLERNSYWNNKANVFSIFCLILNHTREFKQHGADQIKTALENLAATLPPDYVIAAKEAVNNKRERVLRNKILSMAILGIDEN